MSRRKVIDFTKFSGVCGDPVVYVLEAIDSDKDLEYITVVYDNYEELREVAEQLRQLGFEIVKLEGNGGKAILELKVPRKQT